MKDWIVIEYDSVDVGGWGRDPESVPGAVGRLHYAQGRNGTEAIESVATPGGHYSVIVFPTNMTIVKARMVVGEPIGD